MAHKIDKATIARNFSRWAHLYDKYATIQRMAAQELMKALPGDGILSILEIGCGTGNYTSLLKDRYGAAHIKALDISERMIEIARHKLQRDGIEFVVGDAEVMSLDGRFSLITSNAVFQWFEDLKKALANYKVMLIDRGIIAFSTFGPLTFWELSQSLKEISDGSIASYGFLQREEIEAIVSAHFSAFSLKEMVVKERYASLVELLNKIKYTGTRGKGLNGALLWKRELLGRIEDVYRARFGRIEASYQIFFSKAVK